MLLYFDCFLFSFIFDDYRCVVYLLCVYVSLLSDIVFHFPKSALLFHRSSTPLHFHFPASCLPASSSLTTTASLTFFASQMCTCKLSISVCKTAQTHSHAAHRQKHATARELPQIQLNQQHQRKPKRNVSTKG